METRLSKNAINLGAEKFLNEKALLALGWEPVPSIDGSKCESWTDVISEMKQNGLGYYVNKTWVNQPIVVKNQQLFKINGNFVKAITECRSADSIVAMMQQKWKICKRERFYGSIKSHDTEFTKESNAWSFNVQGLAKYSIPESLTITKLDGIIAFGNWFTAGHIETGGDDSITHTPVGRKLMLIEKRGNVSRYIESLMTSVKFLVNFLSKPPPKSVKHRVWFYFTDPLSLMMQPALCAHAVVTLSSGPSMVAGFEGKMECDLLRREQVIQYYSTGLGRERKNALLNMCTDKQICKKLKKLGMSKTALMEHMECFESDETPRLRKVQKVPKVPMRKRKMLFLGRVRRKLERVEVSRKGFRFLLSS